MSTLKLEIGEKNKILRTVSKEAANFGAPELKRLAADMKETLAGIKTGVALAAPQVGINLRIFVLSKEFKTPTVYINPKIKNFGKETFVEEGCLSLPGLVGEVKRFPITRVEAFDENGKKFKLKAEGLLAQAFQHEVDHLNGVLFIDKAVNLRKYENERNYEKEQGL